MGDGAAHGGPEAEGWLEVQAVRVRAETTGNEGQGGEAEDSQPGSGEAEGTGHQPGGDAKGGADELRGTQGRGLLAGRLLLAVRGRDEEP